MLTISAPYTYLLDWFLLPDKYYENIEMTGNVFGLWFRYDEKHWK